jgi:hypothetical protein
MIYWTLKPKLSKIKDIAAHLYFGLRSLYLLYSVSCFLFIEEWLNGNNVHSFIREV